MPVPRDYTWWSEEYLTEILEQARAAKVRAATMREHCRHMQSILLEQQERLRGLMARLDGQADLPPPGNVSGEPSER